MGFLLQFVDILLHIDVHLSALVQDYGVWTYLILFAIVFCETGLVVTPFLPGDSLLFAAGALAGLGALNVGVLIALLVAAAILGDTLNYWIGKWVGPGIFHKDTGRFLKKEHLLRAHNFYEKHGGKTIVLARFVPIVRTFAPFVAGIGRMNYLHFVIYNIAGAVVWVLLFVGGGYWVGNNPAVKKNFSIVIIAIILISVLPMVVEYVRHRRSAK
jgi:membrane-associated protein